MNMGVSRAVESLNMISVAFVHNGYVQFQSYQTLIKKAIVYSVKISKFFCLKGLGKTELYSTAV